MHRSQNWTYAVDRRMRSRAGISVVRRPKPLSQVLHFRMLELGKWAADAVDSHSSSSTARRNRRGPLHLTLGRHHLGQCQRGGHEAILLLIQHQLGETLLTGAQWIALGSQRIGRLSQKAARQGATLAEISRLWQGHSHARIATRSGEAEIRVQGQIRVQSAQRLSHGVHAHGRATRHHQLGMVWKESILFY